MSEINVVPFVDVMLVLLVIFMATAPLLMQGVDIDLPQAPSDPLSDEESDPLVVTVNREGAVFVNTGVRKDTERGRRVTIYSLEDEVARIIGARPNLPVYIRADHTLDYGNVISVMTVLQKAGAESVGLITDPPDISAATEGG